MKDYQSLSHTKWDCKYHVVFIPKYRRKRIFGVADARTPRLTLPSRPPMVGLRTSLKMMR